MIAAAMPENRFWNLLSKKMSGNATPEELAELDRLVRDHPEFNASAEHLENLWKGVPTPHESLNAELAFEEHLEKLKAHNIVFPEFTSPTILPPTGQRRTPLQKRYLQLMAASLVLITGFFAWKLGTGDSTVRAESQSKGNEVSTRTGSRSKLVLPDSTVIWLNAGSKLVYQEGFGITHRNTVLTGEAFFDVKESKVPFVIQVNSMKIRVMGTAFNVRSYPNEKTMETSLLRGKVEVTLDERPGVRFLLHPNEKLVVTNEQAGMTRSSGNPKKPKVVLSELTFTEDSTVVETSWVNNRLLFHDRSFEELAAQMERWYGVTIDIRSERLRRERLSGSFTTETIGEALEALQLTTPFHFTIKSNKITITQ